MWCSSCEGSRGTSNTIATSPSCRRVAPPLLPPRLPGQPIFYPVLDEFNRHIAGHFAAHDQAR
jgi:hypothetical protein